MQNKKITMNLVVIILVLALVFLAGASFLIMKKIRRDYWVMRVSLEKDKEALKSHADALQATINEKQDLFNNADTYKKNYEEQIAFLKEENEKLRSGVDQKIDDLTKKKALLKKRIQKMESAPIDKWIQSMMAGQSDQKIKNILKDALDKVELVKSGKAVTLEPIEVSAADKKGKILSIDRKNDLIVISIGSKDGLMEGDRFNIFSKEGKEIGSAEVISARYAIAAAFVDSMNYGVNINSIKEGFSVAMVEKK
jgi:hypothetical protein